jgi:hypothetical protein
LDGVGKRTVAALARSSLNLTHATVVLIGFALEDEWEGELPMPDQVPSVDSLVGLELSHHDIIEEIGSGGMGVVFPAHDQHLDREVAIKVLSPRTITDEAARKHIRKEALALSKLNHPNIATVYGTHLAPIDKKRGARFRSNLARELKPSI